jgi:glycosyltransferase involved in cell wall biosynthesis
VLRDVQPDVVMTSTTTSPSAALASRRAGIPHVWWVHEFTTRGFERRYALGEAASQRLIGRLSARVAVNSQAVADYYSPPIDRGKMVTVELGVEPSPVEPTAVVDGELHLLMLGRKAPAKGCELALRAVARLRDAPFAPTLRMVGPSVPGYAESLWYLARDLDVLDRVEFEEYCPDPTEHVAWSNVVLVCSEGEAFGRVTVEALKSGRPVIGTRDGGTTELVHDGCDGILVDVGDVGALAQAIDRCGRDPELVAHMAANARSATEGRFTLQGEVDTFVELFDGVRRR